MSPPWIKEASSRQVLFFASIIAAFLVPAYGLRCFVCGQYNDEAGASVTPCINYTAELHLKDCPKNSRFCGKHVSEGITIRDCAEHCDEKARDWSHYCCSEDACNSATSYMSTFATATVAVGLPLIAPGLVRF